MGCEVQGSGPKDPCSIQGLQAGEDRTGESREPSLTPRQEHSRRWDVPAGDRGRSLEGDGCRPNESGRAGTHHRPRGTEGTHPGRICQVWNVTTPTGSSRRSLSSGRSAVRSPDATGGRRTAREANVGGRKAAGNREPSASTSAGGCRITGRIEAGASTRKGADASRVSLRTTSWTQHRNRGTRWTPR